MRNRKVLFAILLGGIKKVKKTTGNSTVYFKSCKAAKAAGYSDMKRGEPGYSTNLDRDGDGVACESK